jgi:hypothetical protein
VPQGYPFPAINREKMKLVLQIITVWVMLSSCIIILTLIWRTSEPSAGPAALKPGGLWNS